MSKRLICGLTALMMLFVLSSCSRQTAWENDAGEWKLPEARAEYDAPDGDRISGEEGLWTLYLPGKNGLNLVAQHVTARTDLLLSERLEAVVTELLNFPSNSYVDALGGDIQLSLAGENAIEYSSGVVTVNLASSALGLSYRAFYIVSLALASTLCELDEVRCVNVLAAGQSVGLDTTGGLPMGSLVAHPGENLPVLWEQMEAKKTPLGNNAEETPLTSYLTLYYPLEDGDGVICENRTLTFEGQSATQLTLEILENLSHGAMYVTGVAQMPDLVDMMIHEPLASDLADGGKMITLSFREGAETEWMEQGVDPACLIAAICDSLTTFIPGLTGVAIRVGDKPLTALNSEYFGEIATQGGLLRRSQFSAFLMGRAAVYFQRNGMLVPCEKNVDRLLADSPREQLTALIDGPGAADLAAGMESTLPEALGADDILAIALEGDTLLVNLSESFRAEIQSWGREKETLLCYSMVNTLCEGCGVKKVCFFFEGEQVDSIAGEICWSGTFDYNTGLCEDSFG